MVKMLERTEDVFEDNNNNKLGVGTKWEEDLYASTDSVAVKCVGKTYPLDHPARAKGSSSNAQRHEEVSIRAHAGKKCLHGAAEVGLGCVGAG